MILNFLNKNYSVQSPKKYLRTILSLELFHKIGEKRSNNNNTTLPSLKPQMGPHDGFDHVICLHAG
jgi:hypothetical protein